MTDKRCDIFFRYLNKYTVVKIVECDDILIFVLCVFIYCAECVIESKSIFWLQQKKKCIFKCGNFSINIINNFGWNVIWLHLKKIRWKYENGIFKNSHDINIRNLENGYNLLWMCVSFMYYIAKLRRLLLNYIFFYSYWLVSVHE